MEEGEPKIKAFDAIMNAWEQNAEQAKERMLQSATNEGRLRAWKKINSDPELKKLISEMSEWKTEKVKDKDEK